MNNSRRGVQMHPIQQADLGSPAAISTIAIVNVGAVAAAGLVTLNGALVAAGVATLGGNYGRAIQLVSSNVGDTTQTMTVRGTDGRGEPVTEILTMNGTTPKLGLKAFRTIASITASAALVGTLSTGTTDKLGIIYRLDGKFDMLRAWADTTDEVTTGTLAVAVTTFPATGITGDVCGTWTPATATNGAVRYRLWYKIADPDTQAGCYGVPEFAG